MALEASEIAVRIRLLGGSAFEKEAASAAKSTEAIGAAGKKANASLVSGSSKAHTALEKTSTKLKKVGGQVTDVGRSLTTMGVPLAAVGYIAGKSSAQFNQAMTLLSTQAGAPAKTIAGLSKQVQMMAPKFGATALSLANALYPIESIGVRGPKALNALKAAAIGSAVGLDSLTNTSDAVTTIMASHIKGSGGPIQAMALMDAAIGKGKMHLQDLTESFKSGIVPMSKAFGLSFKQILAAGSALTREGMPAGSVMARMRLALTSMASPTASGTKALASMGLNQFSLASDLRSPGGLLTALEDLHTHTSGMKPNVANNLIAQIFGKSRGMGQIASLLNALPQMEQIYGSVMGTTPSTLMRHFKQTEATPAFKFKQIQSQAYNALIGLGDTVNKYVLPLLIKMVPYLTQVVSWFGHLPKGLQKFSMVMLGLTIVGGPILLFAGALIRVVGYALPFFSAGLRGLGYSMGASATEMEVAGATMKGNLTKLGGGFLGLLGPIGLLAATIALATNPAISGPIGKFEDKIVGFLTGTKNFGPNNSGHQFGSFAGHNTPPPGYAAFVDPLIHSNPQWVNSHQALLNQWWSTRRKPPELTAMGSHPNVRVEGGGGAGAFDLAISIPLSLDGKMIAEAVAKVNRKSQNRR